MPKKNFAADFSMVQKAEDSFTLISGSEVGSNANVIYFFICCVTSEPEMRVKESSASSKNDNFKNPWPEFNRTAPVILFSAKSEVLPDFFRP